MSLGFSSACDANDLLFLFFPRINRLLVGAPTAQTEQPGVVRGGSVFRCSTEVPDQCQTIPFDVTGKTTPPHIASRWPDGEIVTLSFAFKSADHTHIAPLHLIVSTAYKERPPRKNVDRKSFSLFHSRVPDILESPSTNNRVFFFVVLDRCVSAHYRPASFPCAFRLSFDGRRLIFTLF